MAALDRGPYLRGRSAHNHSCVKACGECRVACEMRARCVRDTRRTSTPHGAMQRPPGAVDGETASAMLRERRDATIRARVLANPTLRAHQQHLESVGVVDSVTKAVPKAASTASPVSRRPRKRSTLQPAPTAAPKPADPHAKHVMPPVKPPVEMVPQTR